MKAKIIFAGVVKNCEEFLPAVLSNIDNIASIASEAAFIFLENDSSDNTKKILREWGAERSNYFLLNFDGLDSNPVRTLRLEFLRNVYIELIKDHQGLRNFDWLVVLDMDDCNTYPIDIHSFKDALGFLDGSPGRAAVFANQKGIYYDLWAFRHDGLCPADVWEAVLDYSMQNNCSDEEAYKARFENCICSFDNEILPLPVNSAFGGLGIYKMKFVVGNNNPYLGSKIKILSNGVGLKNISRLQICEHVHFNLGIHNQGGELYIFPRLINGINASPNFLPSAFKGLIF